jgi:hypothetical protein
MRSPWRRLWGFAHPSPRLRRVSGLGNQCSFGSAILETFAARPAVTPYLGTGSFFAEAPEGLAFVWGVKQNIPIWGLGGVKVL